MNQHRHQSSVSETGSNQTLWGSDVIAATLRDLEVPYVALTPGSSFRGLHDSIVNLFGNEDPRLLLCLHEEHTVAIAHGYYKASGRVMAAAVHANVGLMHATMAIFNAWCDRVPVLVIGAAGPFDAAKRRPWIDWLHTGIDIGSLVRGYTKWDDRPASPEATIEAFIRGHAIARTAPMGPVYVCMDVSAQELEMDPDFSRPDAKRFPAPKSVGIQESDLDQVEAIVRAAKEPLLLIGRVSARREDWDARIAFAERLSAKVITDLKNGARFPTRHPLHPCPPGLLLSAEEQALLRAADLIVSLDWVDLGGTLKHTFGDAPPAAKIVHCSPDQYVHDGWNMDYQIQAPSDFYLLAEPDALVTGLLPRLGTGTEVPVPGRPEVKAAKLPQPGALGMEAFAKVVADGLADKSVCYARLPIGWPGSQCDFEAPLDYLGYDGSGGIGSGPGMCVGAALALKGTDRLAVGVLGDGDYLMGVTALWTAVNQGLPLLLIIANNRSFFNDELHQDRIAQSRGRNRGNRGVGVRMDEPAPDLAKLAEGQGAKGFGPVCDMEALEGAIAEALAVVADGGVAVIDAHVVPEYARGIPENVLKQTEGAA